ncbi:MAG: ATP-grasp domain-containing protein [Flavobacteriales bacterium]
MQKMRTGGYDGKGVTPFRNEQDAEKAFDAPSVLEKWVPFEKEISVLVARNEDGQITAYPTVEMEFNPEANLVEFLFAPAQVSSEIESKAIAIAKDLIQKLDMVGLLAVEMFLTKEGEILVNEIAPRPHNSGHQTIEANITSQYEQHLRAVCNMPLGDTTLVIPVVMVNILGEKGYSGSVRYEGLDQVLQIPGAYIHLYGKSETKPFRKMGHCTVVNVDLETAKANARKVLSTLKVIA